MTYQRRGTIIVVSTLVFTFLALYFGFWGLEADSMEKFYRSGTWYFILVALLLWLQQLATFIPGRDRLRETAVRHGPAVALALALATLAILASPPDFRILADETNLLGMSQAFYEERSCHNPTQALNYYHGIKRTISSAVDTRPAVFSFLTAAAHSLTGFRPENAFVVNAIAGFLILMLCYLLIQQWFGRFWGVAAMLLLAAFPLFILYMTSGGFDIVNLLFALLLIYLSQAFIREPQAERAEMLFLTLPLLAQTRYESALAVFCVIPLVLFCLPRSEYARLTWRTPMIPVLFLPAAWLRVINYSQKAFQVDNIEQAFNLDHLWPNLQHALPFFTGSEKAYGMVMPVAAAAFIGLVWLLADTLRKRGSARPHLAFGIFAAAFFILHALARFVFFWGNLRLQYTSRLGLIFLPLLVFLAIYALRQISRSLQISRSWVPIAAILLMIHGWPVAGKNLAVRDIFYYRELKTVREFLLQNHPNKKSYILVANLSNLYVPFDYSSVTTTWLTKNADEAARSLERRTWQYLLVLQKIDIATNKPVPGSEIPGRFTLKTLYESQLNSDKLIRISRHQPANR